jgi:hypothetical protein
MILNCGHLLEEKSYEQWRRKVLKKCFPVLQFL